MNNKNKKLIQNPIYKRRYIDIVPYEEFIKIPEKFLKPKFKTDKILNKIETLIKETKSLGIQDEIVDTNK